MTIRGFERLEPSRPIDADEMNRALGEIERSTNLTADPPLEVLPQATGNHIRLNAYPPFPVRITGAPVGGAYPWKEQEYRVDGTFIDRSPGLVGTTSPLVLPAYEINGNVTVPVDTIVWLVRGFLSPVHGQEFLFTFCCPLFIWALLTGYDSGSRAYSWIQVDPIAAGEWQATVDGLTGTLTDDSAFEGNRRLIAVGAYVQLWPTAVPRGTSYEWRYVQCCPTALASGTGTGTGEGPGPGAPCDSGTLAATVFVSFLGTGDCDCFNGGPVSLAYNAVSGNYQGTTIGCGGKTIVVTILTGGSSDPTTWSLAVSCNGVGQWSASTPDSANCDPLDLQFTLTSGAFASCCDTTGTTLTADVTD